MGSLHASQKWSFSGKKYFLYSIIKICDVNYCLKERKKYFCNFTIFELVNEIWDFESLWLITLVALFLSHPPCVFLFSLSHKVQGNQYKHTWTASRFSWYLAVTSHCNSFLVDSQQSSHPARNFLSSDKKTIRVRGKTSYLT